MFLIISALPVVTVESKKIEVLKYGTHVSLKCKISSESNITSVKWLKCEQHVYSGTFEKIKHTDNLTNTCSFKEIKKTDSGEYIFESHNAKGCKTKEFRSTQDVYSKYKIVFI